MPPLETYERVAYILWWPKVGHDGYGKPLIGSLTQLRGLWIDKKKDVLDPNGEKISTDVQLQLTREVKVGDLFWKGAAVDFFGTGSGNPDDELYEAISAGTTPDIKSRNTAYDASLIRYRGSLPQRG